MKSGIFIDSFSFRVKQVSSHILFYRWNDDSFPVFADEEKLFFLFNILSSILVHDRIYIKIDALEEIIELIGYSQFITLSEEGLIEILDDTGAHSAFMIQRDGTFLLMNLSEHSLMRFEEISKRLEKRNYDTSKLPKVEKVIADVDGAWLGHLAEQELLKDFENESLRDFFNITSESPFNIKPEDSFNISRILNVNRSLVYLHEEDISNVHLDGISKLILEQKVIHELPSINTETLELFKQISSYKRIPDFSEMYLRNLISIEDILKLRNSFNGKKFRDWFNSKDYDENEVYYELLKTHKKSPLERYFRFYLAVIITIIDHGSGIAAHAVDSFLLDKILKNNWHPNLFLDNQLKNFLENKMRKTNYIK